MPLFSPVMMFMRVCVETPPLWQILLSNIDVARRVDLKRIGKRPLEMLARAGAFFVFAGEHLIRAGSRERRSPRNAGAPVRGPVFLPCGIR